MGNSRHEKTLATMLDHVLTNTVVQTLRTGHLVLDLLLASLVSLAMSRLLQLDVWSYLRRLWRPPRYRYETRVSQSFNLTPRHHGGSKLCFDTLMEYIEDHFDSSECSHTMLFYSHRQNKYQYPDKYEMEHIVANHFPTHMFSMEGLLIELQTQKPHAREKKEPGRAAAEELTSKDTETRGELILSYDDPVVLNAFLTKVQCYIQNKYQQDVHPQAVRFWYAYRESTYLDYHHYLSIIPERSLSHMTLAPAERERLQTLCHDFKHKTGMYHHPDHPQVLTLLFAGPPGNGKTVAIQTLIHYFQIKKVKVISSLSLFKTDVDLRDLLFTKEEGLSMLIFEEIDAGDTQGILKKRSQQQQQQCTKQEKAKVTDTNTTVLDSHALLSQLLLQQQQQQQQQQHQTVLRSVPGEFSLSTWLDAFNGLMTLNNRIIIITTNHLEYLDPAVYRRKRVHGVIRFDNVTEHSLRYFLKLFWQDVDPEWDGGFLQEHPTLNHAFLWDVKDLHQPQTAAEFLLALRKELKR